MQWLELVFSGCPIYYFLPLASKCTCSKYYWSLPGSCISGHILQLFPRRPSIYIFMKFTSLLGWELSLYHLQAQFLDQNPLLCLQSLTDLRSLPEARPSHCYRRWNRIRRARKTVGSWLPAFEQLSWIWLYFFECHKKQSSSILLQTWKAYIFLVLLKTIFLQSFWYNWEHWCWLPRWLSVCLN